MCWLDDLKMELNQFQNDGVNPSQRFEEDQSPKNEDAPQ